MPPTWVERLVFLCKRGFILRARHGFIDLKVAHSISRAGILIRTSSIRTSGVVIWIWVRMWARRWWGHAMIGWWLSPPLFLEALEVCLLFCRPPVPTIHSSQLTRLSLYHPFYLKAPCGFKFPLVLKRHGFRSKTRLCGYLLRARWFGTTGTDNWACSHNPFTNHVSRYGFWFLWLSDINYLKGEIKRAVERKKEVARGESCVSELTGDIYQGSAPSGSFGLSK